ncbi:HAD family phosphatase [Algoriphagus sp. A40]|uniref:HAD family hydrolase n=1 Tax=Algoriphagus sp. A40 TaxID=1945863 RepID=UPI0009863617|nr:HAD family phosphatase [Algoriphagus sp. A40]OOG76153.1 HAD family hydrolase [Algoriphagus sp. A40]
MSLIKNIRGILFDMDGTLVDNIPFHQEAWLRFLGNHGIHLRPEDFHAQNHGTLNEMIRKFFPHVESREKRIELGEEKEATYRHIYRPNLKEIEGLTPFLKFLQSQHISCHLATMGDQNNIDFTLNGLGIRRYFDTVTGGHEVLKGKPDPEIFIKSLKKSGENPENILVFEDSGGGIRSAKSAGLKVIGLATTHSKKELIEMGCVNVFSNFHEAMEVIK